MRCMDVFAAPAFTRKSPYLYHVVRTVRLHCQPHRRFVHREATMVTISGVKLIANSSKEWRAREPQEKSSSITPLATSTEPTHLVLLVNGIFASANDWSFVAQELTTRLGAGVLVHASAANSFFATLEGIDVAGRRLAEEVSELVTKKPHLKRLTVIAHSLGGLIARYAVGKLFDGSPLNGRGSMGGLEPVSFVTLATPHLGVRGRSQLPFLLGMDALEALAPPVASLFAGRTGRQLYLTDTEDNLPLLLAMTADSDSAPFLSALRAFPRRLLYANAEYDHMVGWRTSSIRRERELRKLPKRPLAPRYKHIYRVEKSSGVARSASEGALPSAPSLSAEELEGGGEEMIHRLQRLSWVRVDVSFRAAYWPFFAHNTIHVSFRTGPDGGLGDVDHRP